jgi:hypothetical protein
MIAICREKTELTGCTFEVGSLGAVPLQDASFDAGDREHGAPFLSQSRTGTAGAQAGLGPLGRIAVSSPARPDLDMVVAALIPR